MLVNLLNPINTHLYILNLNTLIYLHELGDLAKSNLEILSWMPLAEANLVIQLPTILSRIPLAEANLVIHLLAYLSRMPLAEANLVIHLPTNLSRMPLVEANLAIHIPAILSRMPLAEANLVNHQTLFTLNTTFIVIAFIRRILNCISANRW